MLAFLGVPWSSPYGTFFDSWQAVNRVKISNDLQEATGRVHVGVRVVAFAHSRADADASSPVCATMIEWAQLLVLPAGVALLELKLYFQRALLWYDALRVRRWLLRDRKAALTVLGALLPVGRYL